MKVRVQFLLLPLLCGIRFPLFAGAETSVHEKLSLVEGKSHVLRMDGDVLRISLAGSSVDATPISARNVLLQALKEGKTTLTIWTQQARDDTLGRPVVLEVDVTEAPGPETRKVEVKVKDTNILNVLSMVAHECNLRLITTGEIRGAVTLDIGPTPLPRALGMICDPNGLKFLLLKDALVVSREPFRERTDVNHESDDEEWLLILVCEMDRKAVNSLKTTWSKGATAQRETQQLLAIQFGRLPYKTNLTAITEKLSARLLSSQGLSASQPDTITWGGVFPVADVFETEGKKSTSKIDFVPFGLKVTVIPDPRSEQVEIIAQESFPDFSRAEIIEGSRVPRLQTRAATMKIGVGDQEAILIRGLLQPGTIKQSSVLNAIPIISELFKSRNYQRGKTEFIVIIHRQRQASSDLQLPGAALTPAQAGTLNQNR